MFIFSINNLNPWGGKKNQSLQITKRNLLEMDLYLHKWNLHVLFINLFVSKLGVHG